MAFPIAGSTSFVTGANRGIGEALVDALVAAGAGKVYAAARRVDDLAPLLHRHGDRVVPVKLDVTDATQIQAAAGFADDVQLLVNNAGVVGFAGGVFTDVQWLAGSRHEFEVNYLGTFAVTQAFAPVLAANGGGAIVNIASVASLVSFPMIAGYSASKAALHSLTQTTRLLLQGQSTQVFGVYPGPIDTRMSAELQMEKTSAPDAARAILHGIEAGDEEIFPDATSIGMGAAFLTDPKGLERQMVAMTAASSAT